MSDIKKYVPLWDKWEIVGTIGSGLYGTVYKIKSDDVFGAVKHIELVLPENADDMVKDEKGEEISVKEKLLNEYLNEIETNYSYIRSKNLLIYEEHLVYENENGYDIFIRMPYLDSLTKILAENQLSDKEKLQLGIDICSALVDLQRRGIFHGDIKPNNIFRNEKGKFVLADFGIAKRPDNVLNKKAVKDTVAFMAPELQENKGDNKTADIYSLGLLMYKLYNSNREPFIEENSSAEEKSEAIIKRIKGVPFPAPENADADLAKVILIACQFAPEARWMNADSFKSALLSYTPANKTEKTSDNTAEAVVASAVVADNVTESLLEEEPPMMVSEFEDNLPLEVDNIIIDDNVLTNDDLDAFEEDDVTDETPETVDIEEQATFEEEPLDTSTKVFSLEENYDNFSDPEFDFAEDEEKKKSKTPIIVIAVILILAILGGLVFFIVNSDIFGGKGASPDSVEPTTEPATTLVVETQPQSTKPTEATKPTEESTEKPTEEATEETNNADVAEVPDVYGWTYEDAEYQLNEAGFEISISNYEHNDYIEENRVVSVYPEVGTELEIGETVYVVISLGPEEAPQSSTSNTYNYDGDYVFADSSTRRLTRDEVIGLDESTLTIAINELFARHGRKFVNQDLANYFNSKSWYNGTIEAETFNQQANSIFNDVEKANRDLMEDILYEKGYW